MASSIVVKVVCLALMCLVLGTPILTDATLTCGDVGSPLPPCTPYFMGDTDLPPQQCCDGIKNLMSEATTKPDRQVVCECFKSGLQSVSSSVLIGKVESLPMMCGVSLTFEISPTVDCTKIQ